MFSTLRNRFGIPGVISTIALVFAMTGGAFAAKYLITSPSQIKPSVLKKLKGPQGATGAAGAQGPAGAAGAAGEKGANGANGTNGAPGEKGEKGAAGTNGKSVKVEEAAEEDCEFGGVIVEEEGVPASGEPVCSGEPGEKGDPWTPDNTLPKGAQLTGAWSLNANAATAGFGVYGVAPISFPIQLKEKLEADKVHYSTESNFKDFDGPGGVELGCKGETEFPSAPEGHLCVYRGLSENVTFAGITSLALSSSPEANPAGALLYFEVGGNEAIALGSWAVTGF